jgi:hypothetical protein
LIITRYLNNTKGDNPITKEGTETMGIIINTNKIHQEVVPITEVMVEGGSPLPTIKVVTTDPQVNNRAVPITIIKVILKFKTTGPINMPDAAMIGTKEEEEMGLGIGDPCSSKHHSNILNIALHHRLLNLVRRNGLARNLVYRRSSEG